MLIIIPCLFLSVPVLWEFLTLCISLGLKNSFRKEKRDPCDHFFFWLFLLHLLSKWVLNSLSWAKALLMNKEADLDLDTLLLSQCSLFRGPSRSPRVYLSVGVGWVHGCRWKEGTQTKNSDLPINCPSHETVVCLPFYSFFPPRLFFPMLYFTLWTSWQELLGAVQIGKQAENRTHLTLVNLPQNKLFRRVLRKACRIPGRVICSLRVWSELLELRGLLFLCG